MINFDEELKFFSPSLEISEVEDAVVKSDFIDFNDILMEILREQMKE